MAVPGHAHIRNKLLSLLPAEDFHQISSSLEEVSLPKGMKLAEAGERIEYIYFLTEGVGSVTIETPEGNRAEAGIFGPEGYIPSSGAAEVEISGHDAAMQIEGEALRMDYDAFRERMDKNPSFGKVMIRSMEAFTIQLAFTAGSNAIHDINTRLARWLLMCHDRVVGNEILLTHDYIALMLAVRRPSVTLALHTLEGKGMIRSNRGAVTIRSRQALEEFAHDAYGIPEAEYRRLMSGLFDRPTPG